HVAQFDRPRVSDCGRIRSELVCGKRRAAVWHYANGRSANSYSSYRDGIGILARTVESHFEPRSYAAALELGTYYHGCPSGLLEINSGGTAWGFRPSPVSLLTIWRSTSFLTDIDPVFPADYLVRRGGALPSRQRMGFEPKRTGSSKRIY